MANIIVLLCLQLLSANFYKFLCHKQMFGYWYVRGKSNNESSSGSNQSDGIVNERIENWSTKHRGNYKKGNVVKYKDNVYTAMGSHQNVGIPGNIVDLIVYVCI
jgi:hypothetical protein